MLQNILTQTFLPLAYLGDLCLGPVVFELVLVFVTCVFLSKISLDTGACICNLWVPSPILLDIVNCICNLCVSLQDVIGHGACICNLLVPSPDIIVFVTCVFLFKISLDIVNCVLLYKISLDTDISSECLRRP